MKTPRTCHVIPHGKLTPEKPGFYYPGSNTHYTRTESGAVINQDKAGRVSKKERMRLRRQQQPA